MMAAINIGAVLVVQAGKFRVSESKESRNATRQWIMMAVIIYKYRCHAHRPGGCCTWSALWALVRVAPYESLQRRTTLQQRTSKTVLAMGGAAREAAMGGTAGSRLIRVRSRACRDELGESYMTLCMTK